MSSETLWFKIFYLMRDTARALVKTSLRQEN